MVMRNSRLLQAARRQPRPAICMQPSLDVTFSRTRTKDPVTPNRQKIFPRSALRLDRRFVEATEDGNDDITGMWDHASPGVKRDLERMEDALKHPNPE